MKESSTSDYIYLLSINDVTNESYGFPNVYSCGSNSRIAVPTNSEESSSWWLRSIDNEDDEVMCVNYNGASWWEYDYNDKYGVRPALHIDLSSSVWTKGKEVTSEDQKTIITDSLPGEEDEDSNDSKDTPNNPTNSTQGKTNSNTATGNLTSGNNLTSSNTSISSTAASTKTQLAKVKKVKAKNKKGKKILLSWKKVKNATGYQIKYTTDKKMKKKLKYKTVSKNKATLSKLKKKTYYIRIRAIKTKNNVSTFGAWSAVKKVKIKK